MQMTTTALTLLCCLSVATAWNPSNSYEPSFVECPSNISTFVRPADSLNSNEQQWVNGRQELIRPAQIDFLNRANLTDFDVESFLSNVTMNIGLAFSGGGYRAMLSGAGQFAGLDNRTVNSTQKGHLGGLVQASTYLAGLSGGNWLVGSIVLNNFTSIQELQGSDDLWDLKHSILAPGGINIFKDASYWDGIKDAVDSKSDAGFNTSITDIWGRGLSQQFIGLDDGGPALTWNDIQTFPVFENHSMPFPIVVSDGREPGTKILATNSTIFEFTPFELGSWDPALFAFTDLKYLGSNVTNGIPNNKSSCVLGFDQAGFTMGTSSSLFNQFILQLNSSGVTGAVWSLANNLLTDLGERNDDIAVYSPNPFHGVNFGNSSIKDAKYLTLVDGGEDNENIPLYPLLQPERKVDVIFAFDNSADTTYSWPNGSSLVQSYERQFNIESNRTVFPYVPDTNTFINSGLVERPTFFGCDAKNLSTLFEPGTTIENQHLPPLIVYVGNFAHSFFSNESTFKLSYDTDEVAGMIQNGYNVVTRQNSTLDEEWPACVACAIVQREVERRGQSPTAQCQQCFNKYCWDGTIDSKSVNETGPDFDPTLTIKSGVPCTSETLNKVLLAAALGAGALLTYAL